MIRRAALLALLCGQPAGAEPWIDYDLLMQLHQDKVVTTTDASGRQVRRLDFGDGVTVTCDADGCVGMDMTGATGCTFTIVAGLRAAATECALAVPPDQRDTLDRLYELAGRHVAANAVPPMEWSTLDARWLSDLQEEDSYTPEFCAEMRDPDQGILDFIAAVTDPETVRKIEQDLLTPRLPIMNPCL